MEKLKKLSKFSKLQKIVSLVLFAAIFYFAGFLTGHHNLVFEKNFQPKVINKELFKPSTVDFSQFWTAWNLVMEKSVDNPDTQKMVKGAISGMVDSLGDPYSTFMPADTSKLFMEDLSGEIQGIGAELSVKDGKLVVVTPLASSPAEKIGLKPNDQIVQINGNDVGNFSLEEAVSQIRGNAGTKVKLTIMREGWATPQVFEVQREKITIKSVEWSMKGNIGYIKITQFGDDTNGLLQQAATSLGAQKPKAIVMDLRRNPGGYLESAVDTVSLFSQPGMAVVKVKDKSGKVEIEQTKAVTNSDNLKNIKMVVLIDEGSASAAEIVAGALQDNGRATLVGEKSFGKGSVQEVDGLGNGNQLKLTIAEWLTPKDRHINHIGIEPDVKVTLTDDDIKANRDPQLDKALELANQ